MRVPGPCNLYIVQKQSGDSARPVLPVVVTGYGMHWIILLHFHNSVWQSSHYSLLKNNSGSECSIANQRFETGYSSPGPRKMFFELPNYSQKHCMYFLQHSHNRLFAQVFPCPE